MRTLTLLAAFALAAPVTHAATLLVDQQAANAADANPGTRAAPFKTIDAAAKVAKAGDTVLVRPGLYREAVTVRVSGTTFQSEVPGAAVIDGADVVPAAGLRAETDGVFSFAAPDIVLNPYDEFGGARGEWVYVNGEPLQNITTKNGTDKSKMAPEVFYEDFDAKRIYFQPGEDFNSRTSIVELAHRDGLMSAEHRDINTTVPLDDIVIRGFTLQHNADWFVGRRAITLRGRRWLVENNTVRWGSWGGIGGDHATDCVIRNNTVEWGGDTGIGLSNSYHLLVEGNKVFHCNWRRINPGFDGGFGKFTASIDCRIQGNESAYHYGFGPWFDIHNMGNVLDGNVSHDSIGGAGLFSEISTDTTFLNNVVYNMRDDALTFGESISCVARHNIVFNNGQGLRVRGNYTRHNDHDSLAGANTPGYFSPGERGFREGVDAMPDLNPQRRDEYLAKYYLYWAAPKAYPSNNGLWWENFSFNNGANYVEERDYAQPSATDPFVNNLSDLNLFFPDGRIETKGRRLDLATWQKVSGRDEHSQVIDPRAAGAKLPDWVEARRALWAQPMRTREQIDALNLGLLDSPSGAECRARFFRSPAPKHVTLADPAVQAWLLTVGGQRTLAVWTTSAGERRPVRLRVGANAVVYESPYGIPTKRRLPGGAIELTATALPRYVRGVGAAVVEAPLGALRAPGFNAPGAPVPVTATFTNETGRPQRLQATFGASDGFRPQPAHVTQTLAPGRTAQVKVSLRPGGAFRRGRATVRMDAMLGGETLRRSAAFTVGEGSGRIARATHPLTLDGSLDDWKALGAGALLGTVGDAADFATGDKAKWGGPADLSAKLYAAWAPDVLYVGVQVTDNSVVPAPPGAPAYDWDAVEFFVDGRDPAFQYNPEPTPGVFQIAVSPSGKPPVTQVLSKTGLQRLQAASARTPDGYTIEIKIPLTAANFPAGGFTPGRPLKLSLLLDDRDDPQGARKAVFGWSFSPNGANFGDTSGWKTLTLAP